MLTFPVENPGTAQARAGAPAAKKRAKKAVTERRRMSFSLIALPLETGGDNPNTRQRRRPLRLPRYFRRTESAQAISGVRPVDATGRRLITSKFLEKNER
jgi:hypothetical protein